MTKYYISNLGNIFLPPVKLTLNLQPNDKFCLK